MLASSFSFLASSTAPGLDTSGVSTWLTRNVLNLVILAIGIILVARAHKQDHRGAMTTFGIVLVGLVVLGLSVGNHALNVSAALSSLIFGH